MTINLHIVNYYDIYAPIRKKCKENFAKTIDKCAWQCYNKLAKLTWQK